MEKPFFGGWNLDRIDKSGKDVPFLLNPYHLGAQKLALLEDSKTFFPPFPFIFCIDDDKYK